MSTGGQGTSTGNEHGQAHVLRMQSSHRSTLRRRLARIHPFRKPACFWWCTLQLRAVTIAVVSALSVLSTQRQCGETEGVRQGVQEGWGEYRREYRGVVWEGVQYGGWQYGREGVREGVSEYGRAGHKHGQRTRPGARSAHAALASFHAPPALSHSSFPQARLFVAVHATRSGNRRR